MRRLMWFSVGFAVACAAGISLVQGSWLFLLALFCLLGAIALCFLKTTAAKISVVVLLGMMLGFAWVGCYDTFYLGKARAYDGETVTLAIEVCDYSYETTYGAAADGKIHLGDTAYRIRFYLNSDKTLSPGDQVTGSFLLRYTANGGEKEPTYHQGNGIFLLVYEKADVFVVRAQQVEAKYFAVTLRNNILHMLDTVFPADTLAFARALLLGDRTLFTYEEDTALQLSGTSHVVAVSGMHVSILFSLLYLLSGKRRVLTALLGVPLLVLFAAVAGFTPSIVRACIMQVLMILALMLNKEYDPLTALGFSVLTMLAVNPLTITSVSFQLSVGSILGILLFSQPISSHVLESKRFAGMNKKSKKARLLRTVVNSVSVSLAATVFTMPLCAYYFGTVSLVAPISNLLVLWVVSGIFYGIMAACAAGFLWMPLAKGIAWLVSWPIRYVLYVVKLLAGLPLAAVYTNSVYIIIWLVFSYILLAAFCILPQKRPVTFALCISAALALSLGVSYLEPGLGDFRLTVLDVGQGQCVLLQSDGRTYMVDCGGDSATDAADMAAQTLLSQGITSLDGVILTHYDSDHADGIMHLLTRIPADTLYLPLVADDSGIQEAFISSWPESITWVSQDTVLTYGDTCLTLFQGEPGESANESSLCVLFQPGNYDILITGDQTAAGEKALASRAELPVLEVLVAGNHGANTSTCMELLEATKPAAVVVSVGENNRFNHPSQALLDRLRLFDSQVFRTDLHGTVFFRG